MKSRLESSECIHTYMKLRHFKSAHLTELNICKCVSTNYHIKLICSQSTGRSKLELRHGEMVIWRELWSNRHGIKKAICAKQPVLIREKLKSCGTFFYNNSAATSTSTTQIHFSLKSPFSFAYIYAFI